MPNTIGEYGKNYAVNGTLILEYPSVNTVGVLNPQLSGSAVTLKPVQNFGGLAKRTVSGAGSYTQNMPALASFRGLLYAFDGQGQVVVNLGTRE